MPPDLKAMRKQIAELAAQENSASADQDYEHAMEYKSERLKLQEEYEIQRDAWQREFVGTVRAACGGHATRTVDTNASVTHFVKKGSESTGDRPV